MQPLMRLDYRIALASLTICGCATPIGEQGARFEFGKLRAALDGRDFSGSFGPGSVVAIWSVVPSQMQIEGDKPGNGRAVVRLTMRCRALPKPGSYTIGDLSSPVSIYASVEPRLWQRASPLRLRRYRPFISDSLRPGILTLDTVDSANGIIKGRFAASLTTFDEPPVRRTNVRGNFYGRLSINTHFPTKNPRWAKDI